MKPRDFQARIAVIVAAAMLLSGCAHEAQRWVKPGAAAIERLAVLPFENQTTAVRAGAVVSDLLVTELLAARSGAVMDPSEVADLLRRDNIDAADPARWPSAQRIGRLLRVSHVMEGAVIEYRYKPGVSEAPAVGITARVVDVASGDVVWTASVSRASTTWFREDGLARVAQSIARDMARHLAESLSSGAR